MNYHELLEVFNVIYEDVEPDESGFIPDAFYYHGVEGIGTDEPTKFEQTQNEYNGTKHTN